MDEAVSRTDQDGGITPNGQRGGAVSSYPGCREAEPYLNYLFPLPRRREAYNRVFGKSIRSVPHSQPPTPKPTFFTSKPVSLTAERGRPRKALATKLIKNEVPEKMEIAMTYYDPALKTYADSGLRSARDWARLGRDVKPEIKPRADTLHRGALLPLYSRDQTRVLKGRCQDAGKSD